LFVELFFGGRGGYKEKMSFEIRFSTFMSGEFYYVFFWRFILTKCF
jgi:hypothetical protein